jgi:O-antigen ligase
MPILTASSIQKGLTNQLSILANSISTPFGRFVFRTRLYFNLEKQRRDLLIAIMLIVAFLSVVLGTFAIGKMNLGLWVVGGVVAALIGISIIFKPEFGLFVLVFFVYGNVSDVLEVSFGIPSTNKALVALIYVGVLGSRVILQKRPFVFRASEILILMYGVTIVVSLIVSEFQNDAVTLASDWFKDFAIMLLVIQLGSREDVLKRGMWILVLTAALLSLLSTYQNLTGDFTNEFFGFAKAPVHEIITGVDGARVTGPLDDPNFYGLILLLAYPAAIYRLFSDDKKWLKGLAAVCTALIVSTIILTYSRGAFLALVVVSILIVRERKMNPYKIGAIALFMFIVLLPVMPAGFTDRLSTLGLFTNDKVPVTTESSFQGRTSEAIVALRMFRDYPLLGVGRGNYPRLYQTYSRRLGIDHRATERDAHSLYLEVIAETGIIGITLFILIIVVVFRELNRATRLAKRIDRDDLITWIAGIRYGLMGYLLGSIFLHGVTIRYLWLIMGFALVSAVMVTELTYHYNRHRLQFENETSFLDSVSTTPEMVMYPQR